MTPEAFIAKWRGVELSERSASQSHFNDLCDLVEVKKPADDDPTGERFTFEKAVPKAGKAGKGGFADVWRKGCFVWEYKRKGKHPTLAAALAQARDYADLLEHPPLAIACDIDEIQIRTLFTGSVSVVHSIRLIDLNDVSKRRLLHRCFTQPASLRSDVTPQAVTEEAARKFATLAQNLRERRDRLGHPHDPRRVAHFLNRIIFCLFAERSGLLPGDVFSSIIEEAVRDRTGLSDMLADLFDKMRTGKGRFGTVAIPWFNGGLFDDDDVLDLPFAEVLILAEAARLDWAHIEPVIFGTLFERGLDPARRKEMAGLFDVAAEGKGTKGKKGKDAATPPPPALSLRGGATAAQRSLGKGVGIHYTDTATIMKIVEPVVLRPLAADWQRTKAAITKTNRVAQKNDLYLTFRERLGAYRVLDPACGSGNFLYLSLRHLKDFDRKVEEEAKSLGVTADPKGQRITPKTVLGIEVNPYAAELARVTVWIGELQWQMANGYGVTRRPILGALEGIENRDALLDDKDKEATWPKATAVVGNPPFLGGKLLRRNLGDRTVDSLFAIYGQRVPSEADLVCYWLAKGLDCIIAHDAQRVGFVATNSIRGGANRVVLDRVSAHGRIFDAWSDEPWILDGAAVRVSLVSFDGSKGAVGARLNGRDIETVNTDLTSSSFDLTKAQRLTENFGTAFQGPVKVGAFDIDGEVARGWLKLATNPNGRTNTDVLRPWTNGMDITRRPSGRWIIDFEEMTEKDASLYEAPFEYLRKEVRPERVKNRDQQRRQHWWRLGRSGTDYKQASQGLTRVILTPRVAKHRLFVWRPMQTLPDSAVVAIAKDDDTTFGIVHSRLHELWALRLGTSLEDRPRYTPSTTFETFPFPDGMTPNIASAKYSGDRRAKRIAVAMAKLHELRENWLNPPDLVKREPEIVAAYPERILPKNLAAADQLEKRTLTNLYNARPSWLANAHKDLDRAVISAYGWPETLADRVQPENPDPVDREAAEDELLRLLFDLNQARAKARR